MSVRRLVALSVLPSALLLVAPTLPAAASAPGIQVVDGRTQPVFSYAEAIREHVMVESPVDSDADGRLDLVSVDVIRPRQTEQGLKVPVIMDESPYYDNLGRGNEAERKRYAADGTPVGFPLFYDNYFVPRGYAVLLVDMIGTTRSDGCPTTGGAGDVLGGKAVIDWLNGRARAFDQAGHEVAATWTTGRVAMIGKSYDGTLPNAVAATGVEGLVTIVPIAAISRWYDYYRMNGVVYFRNGPRGLARTVDTDPDAKCAAMQAHLGTGAADETGDHNAFWAERDYIDGLLASARDVRASVFVVHGLNDLNVKPNHFSAWWEELRRGNVPRKLWLSRFGHEEGFDFRREVWVDTLHRWFDHWLYGVDNKIMDEPMVDVQTGVDTWTTERDWPPPGTAPMPLWLNDGAAAEQGPGGAAPVPAPHARPVSFTDDPVQTEAQMIADPDVARSNRLVFVTPPLRADLRLAGVPEIEIEASFDAPAANLTALIVDYGEAERIDYRISEGLRTVTGVQSCHGAGTADDDGCYDVLEPILRTAPAEIINRGWLDARNRDSLSAPEPLVPGRTYRLRWSGLPHDYTVPAGHRLAVIVAGTDRSFTSSGQAPPVRVTVDPLHSRVLLPVASGRLGPSDFGPPGLAGWRGPGLLDLTVHDPMDH